MDDSSSVTGSIDDGDCAKGVAPILPRMSSLGKLGGDSNSPCQSSWAARVLSPSTGVGALWVMI
uniref:Uncharacterized protein n=1 Tax=Pandoraea norimbergensis TaxID=93219 RepID=A0ABN4JJW6_9BURK